MASLPWLSRATIVLSIVFAGSALPAAPSSAATAAPTAIAALVADPASVVNPFIGTTNLADDFPGADVPFGMVQWSPDTPSRPQGGGYEYNDSSITGFSLGHTAGPGCGATGDIPILPTVGGINTGATDAFSHANESANAGYYSVNLSDGVHTELTTTTRSGMARFTFPSTTQANLIFKLGGSQNGDTNTQFTVVSGTEVSGQITSGHFCGAGDTYTEYFDMVFDQPTTSTGTSGTNGYVTFNASTNHVVQAKVGVSFVSIANAKGNAAAENSGWNFDATHTAAHNAWNSVLGRIGIAGGTAAQQAVFYTALYHTLLHPNVVSDTNGQYLGFDNAVHTVTSGHGAQYATFSGWDIYRSQAQLSAFVAPSQASDIAQSMVNDYAQSGMLPKWALYNGETYVMVGDPADSILADYYAFGGTNFDTAAAKTAMINEATTTNNIRPGLNYLTSLGYLPSNGSYGCCNFYGPASTTLEYDTADFAISAFAGALGDTANQNNFANRAQDWKNLFNSASGFIQPRDANGAWTSGFNPTSGTNFVEGDSWQYTPMVPYNLRGLADAKGGNASMVSFLDTDLADLTGANGHTDLTNEPSLNIPWEYDYVGQPYKTQQVIRRIQDQIWTDAPNGLAGNDDLGTMSAWYVWSALGMYPETPGTSDLALASPMFTQIVITLPSGNTLTINGNGAADNAPYVQSATWNGAAWNNAYAPAGAITTGGTLNYTLGTTANTSWASAASSAPPSYPGNGGGTTVGYNDIGISNDGSAGANFDGGGYSYSAQSLATAGVTPGSTVTAGGSTFTWPNVAAGQPDNYQANGQTVKVSGSGSISFLGSSTNGPSSGTATVTFTDGTTQAVTLGFSDWTLNGGSATVMAGNTVAITTPHRNDSAGASQVITTDVFATTPVTLTAGKTVASVTLPASVNQGAVHVFAISTSGGGSGTPHTGAIVSGVSSTLCVDDNGGSTTNGSHIQIWACNGGAAQTWTVNANNTLTVVGKCMDVTSSGTANGTLIQLYDCNGTGAQVWQPQSNGALLNPQSGKCLDDPASTTTQGTQLQLYTCNGTNAQRWTLPS